MTSKEYLELQKKQAQRYQNGVNRVQGAAFENTINAACEYYRLRDAANIEKTPEPMQPTKDLGNGKFIAHYVKAAQPDYKGTLAGGRSVCFEAKYTQTDRMADSRVTPEQARELDKHQKLGAVCFVLASFSGWKYYRIPWEVWKTMREHFGHKYITPNELKQFTISFGGTGVLLFLEGVETKGA